MGLKFILAARSLSTRVEASVQRHSDICNHYGINMPEACAPCLIAMIQFFHKTAYLRIQI